MKLRLMIAVLFVAACASKSTQLTESEVASLLGRHENMFSSIQARAEVGQRYKHYYYECNEDKSSCKKFECFGVVQPGVKCWLSSASQSEIQEMFGAALAGSPNLQLARQKCESPEAPIESRRVQYMEYLTADSSTISISEYMKVLTMFCDWNGVACKKDGQKFGKGTLSNSSRGRLNAGARDIYHKSSGQKTVTTRYEFAILN